MEESEGESGEIQDEVVQDVIVHPVLLKKARKSKGLTEADLAKMADIQESELRFLETTLHPCRTKLTFVPVVVASRLAKSLGVDIKDISS